MSSTQSNFGVRVGFRGFAVSEAQTTEIMEAIRAVIATKAVEISNGADVVIGGAIREGKDWVIEVGAAADVKLM